MKCRRFSAMRWKRCAVPVDSPTPDATWLIAQADQLMLDAHNLRELADRVDALSVQVRQLGFQLLIAPKEGNDV